MDSIITAGLLVSLTANVVLLMTVIILSFAGKEAVRRAKKRNAERDKIVSARSRRGEVF